MTMNMKHSESEINNKHTNYMPTKLPVGGLKSLIKQILGYIYHYSICVSILEVIIFDS